MTEAGYSLNSKATTEGCHLERSKAAWLAQSRDLLFAWEKQVSPLRSASLREATTPVEMTGYFEIEPLPNTQRQELLRRGASNSDLFRKYHVYLDVVSAIQYYPESYETRLKELFPSS